NLSSVNTEYDYIGPFVYKNDLLQTRKHEEGRCRPVDDPALTTAAFMYDDYTQDPLGNVRAVINEKDYNQSGLTNGSGTPTSYVATHEVSLYNQEALTWDNIQDVWALK